MDDDISLTIGNLPLRDVQQLYATLVADRTGQVELTPATQRADGLGLFSDIALVLGPSGLSAFVGSLVRYLRFRSSDVSVELRRSDGQVVTVKAERVRQLSLDELREFTAGLERDLAGG